MEQHPRAGRQHDVCVMVGGSNSCGHQLTLDHVGQSQKPRESQFIQHEQGLHITHVQQVAVRHEGTAEGGLTCPPQVANRSDLLFFDVTAAHALSYLVTN